MNESSCCAVEEVERHPSTCAVSVGWVVALVVALAAGEVAAQESDGGDDGETSAAVLPSGGVVGTGLGFYFENSRLEGEETRESQTTDQSYDYSADNLLRGSLWFLKAISGNRVRVGGGLAYFGAYEGMREPEEDEEADEIEAYEYGQMVTPFARGEWLIPFLDRFQLALGAQAGLTVLFPDGEFRREIDDMKDQDISVFGGPRFGVDLAPRVGTRWQIDERLALRADFGVHWQRIFMLNVDDSVEGVDFSRDWTLKVLRYDLGLTMEVAL